MTATATITITTAISGTIIITVTIITTAFANQLQRRVHFFFFFFPDFCDVMTTVNFLCKIPRSAAGCGTFLFCFLLVFLLVLCRLSPAYTLGEAYFSFLFLVPICAKAGAASGAAAGAPAPSLRG